VLAGNFVREQRLIIGLMSAWMLSFAVLFAFVSDARTGPGDLEVLYRQELAYGIALALFSGATVVHSERRSRRILAVLSKGIHRAQFLAGAALGIACTTAIYYALVAVTNQWLIQHLHFQGEAFTAAAFGWTIAQSAAVVGLAFGTFLHPLFAAPMAGVVCAAGVVIPVHPYAFPVSYFLRAALFATYERGLHWNSDPSVIVYAAIETAIAFTIAVWIFRRRDITVAVE
jgi:ABC-type transport system involved in multi-copper enzyme maturation permease subunit